jgi:organic radical activating enzyme
MEIPFLVVIVGQACTLRCKDCGNFTAIAPKNALVYSVDQILEDLRTILQHATIRDLQIQGGEPFLYPNLNELLRFCVEHENITNVTIATNGTLLPKAEIELLQNKKIFVRISNYKPFKDKGEKLSAFLNENAVRNGVYNFVGRNAMWHDMGYAPPLSLDEEQADDNTCKSRFESCAFKICLTLEQSKLGYCSRSIIAESVQGFSAKQGDYCIISPTPPPDEFRKQLEQYIENRHFMEACRFCNGSAAGKFVEAAIQL